MQTMLPPELRRAAAFQGYGQGGGETRRLEQYTFAHSFASVLTGAEADHTFNIGAEAHFFLTHMNIWTNQTVASQAMAAVSYRLESSTSGRMHDSDFVLAINLHGTIGLPYQVMQTLFEARSNFRVRVRNDSGSTAKIDVAFMGYRLYPS